MLTEREKEVLYWTTQGKTNWEIAVILAVSDETIKQHISNILKKLGAVNRAHAVAIACKNVTIQHELVYQQHP